MVFYSQSVGIHNQKESRRLKWHVKTDVSAPSPSVVPPIDDLLDPLGLGLPSCKQRRLVGGHAASGGRVSNH